MPGPVLVNVQTLRAIAALLVVVHHEYEFLRADVLGIFERRIGASGVDLFFVISGFIMVHTTRSGRIGAGAFLLRRFLRIAPLYYLFTALIFLLVRVGPGPLDKDAYTLGFVASLMFVPFQSAEGNILPIYGVGWTLNYEMFFYALFAAALAVSRRSAALVVSLAIVGLGLVGRTVGAEPLDALDTVSYALTRPIMMDFVLGMAVASIAPAITRLVIAKPWTPWAILGTFLVLCWACGTFTVAPISVHDPDTDTLVRFGVPAAALLASAIAFEARGIRPGHRALGPVGDASYSIYLTHVFIIWSLASVLDAAQAPWNVRLAFGIATPLISAIFGLAVFRTLEQPLGRLIGRRPTARVAEAAA